MNNNIYISFSSENSSSDSWVSEFLNYLKVTLGKISSLPLTFSSSIEKDSDPEKQIQQAQLILLVFNGFVSDDFSKCLKIVELKYPELLASGKEIYIIVKSGKFGSIIPVFLRRFIQYNFFEINTRTNEIIDFAPFLKGEKENKFWSKLTDLAYDIKLFLELQNGKKRDENNLTVYLAEVSKDQSSNREILRREFLLSGYTVLPFKPLPTSFKDYQEACLELLKVSDISIHIMGEVYGESPSGSDYSYQEIQNRIIADSFTRTENKLKDNFYRFVWLPPNLEPYDEKQIQYLKRLRRELSESRNSELIQSSIEEFKELFLQKLGQLKGNHPLSVSENKANHLVLITDNSNQPLFNKIENQLKISNKSYEVIDLYQTGELLPLAMFRQKFKSAGAAIIVNNSRDDSWIQGMIGLTIKNLNHTRVAAVSNIESTKTIDFEGLNIDFFSSEDGQLIKSIENFLIQMS